jgi:hypothetical protein
MSQPDPDDVNLPSLRDRFFSVREELVPKAIVSVKLFEGRTSADIEEAINKWIMTTQNLVVCPGPLSTGVDKAVMAVTYVEANNNVDPQRKRKVVETPKPDAGVHSGRLGLESDGGRIA